MDALATYSEGASAEPKASAPILNALPAHVAVLDSTGKIIAVNQAWETFATKNALQGSHFGIGENYIQVCERAVGDCSEEARAAALGIRSVLDGEYEGFSIDYPCHSETEQRWFRLIVASLVEKPLDGAVVMHLNITESKKGELASRRLAAIVESSDDAIIGKDLNSIITEWNKGAEKIFGYTAEEIVGTSIMRLIPPERQEDESVILARIKKGESVQHFATIRQTKDGRLINVSVTASPIKNEAGVPIGVSKAMRDITAVKRAEDALREREEQLRLYAQHIPVAVAMFDRQMKYLVASCRWIEDFQLQKEDIIGRSHYEIFPEMPQRWKEVHQRCLAGAVEKCDEDAFVRTDGATEWLRWEVRPWRQADGEIGGIIIFSECITERKEAEEKGKRQLTELLRWQATTIGREKRIVELKAEINKLLAEQGKPTRYGSPTLS